MKFKINITEILKILLKLIQRLLPHKLISIDTSLLRNACIFHYILNFRQNGHSQDEMGISCKTYSSWNVMIRIF